MKIDGVDELVCGENRLSWEIEVRSTKFKSINDLTLRLRELGYYSYFWVLEKLNIQLPQRP